MNEVHISSIKAGDLILHKGVLKTVGRKNIKRCPFMGTSLFGDSYKSGNEPVKKITSNELINLYK